jgi:CheY-like chemotaxis protein/HPt (histidine-containing phosphotransfer) domain-containing protein
LLLVAEDDPINRQVLKRQLALLGYAAEFAEDGLSALHLWRQHRHALLLTDLQMPRLDGCQLAAAIRAEEGTAGPGRFPILALTANALAGEAQRARAAGVDDYLTKPVPMRVLLAALNQWMPAPVVTAAVAGETPEAPSLEPAAPSPAGLAVLDLAVLRHLVGDDEETLRELLGDFVRLARSQANQLHEATGEGRASSVAGIAHRLKSSSRSVGALALGQLCADIEAQAQGSLPQQSQLQAFEAAVVEVEAAIRSHLAPAAA